MGQYVVGLTPISWVGSAVGQYLTSYFAPVIGLREERRVNQWNHDD